jgi:ribose transport system ATP-binding protein
LTAAPALQVSDVAKRFGATVALDGVDLTLHPGEVHALIGENGAGKSTLMNILVGALRPDRGELRIGGVPYAPSSPLDARNRGLALIHQELSLCPHLSVAENILLGVEPARAGWLDRREAHRRACAVLEAFGHADLDPARRVADLPVAARQVVEICRALAANARIMLMDEPTSSLRREDVARLFALVRRLCAQGIAVIYISHFLEEVRDVADRFTVLRDGCTVGTGRVADVSNEQLIAAMVGRPIDRLFPVRPAAAEHDVLLDVRNLAAPPVLLHASFTLRRGEILGIAGLMGSGRTELVRALFGLLPVSSGTIELRGTTSSPRHVSPAARIRQGFGYLSEDRIGEALALPLSVADNLTLTRLSTAVRRAGWLDRRRQDQRARTWLHRLDIRARSPRQPVRTLSGGNQQKVVIGRLLHQDADILLLDEPTRGIDIGSKAQVYETVARAAAQGRAVLLVSSYLPELFGMCDRIAVMSRGRLSPARPVADWTPESVMAAAIGAAGMA